MSMQVSYTAGLHGTDCAYLYVYHTGANYAVLVVNIMASCTRNTISDSTWPITLKVQNAKVVCGFDRYVTQLFSESSLHQCFQCAVKNEVPYAQDNFKLKNSAV